MGTAHAQTQACAHVSEQRSALEDLERAARSARARRGELERRAAEIDRALSQDSSSALVAERKELTANLHSLDAILRPIETQAAAIAEAIRRAELDNATCITSA